MSLRAGDQLGEPTRAGDSPERLALSRQERRQLRHQLGWVEQTLAGVTEAIERAVFTEEHARSPGWLQGLDPRVKLGMFVVTVLAASLSHSLLALLLLYGALLLAARASLLPFDFFVRRVWLGIPFFAGIVILPSIFFTSGGPRLFELVIGPLHLGPTPASLLGAAVFVMRVGDAVSLAVLLILTTRWADLLKSLQVLRVPQIFILLLSMTYRYIFLFLHTVNGFFEARKSRTVGLTSGSEQRTWIVAALVTLMNRSFQMSNEVYAAMCARGFTGTIRTYSDYRLRTGDVLAFLGTALLAIGLFFLGRVIV
ncbi:cobalt ECF transporter T component CbiQ [Thermogemmatispora sp.]|uniref:cobalt ECF transporter T component CbiQ n=1 Tax=Thermogemmatispora sp. TaxID=1968838 RepID=UPI001E17145A|nr:cobalt ECF transporter T component CbiQ [Thermogemmatispora sp.]MBX5451800.1 cobalt ECF transporter T component CbiQ [Thermogemmatispora sp.]